MGDRVRELVDAGMTVLKAVNQVAAETNRTLSALKQEYYIHHKSSVKAHGNALLTCEEDKILVNLAVAFSCSNRGLNTDLLKYAVRTLFGKYPDPKWYKRWMRVNSKYVSARVTKHLKNDRHSEQTLIDVEEFITAVNKAHETHMYDPSRVINYDETRVGINPSGEVLFERVGKERGNASTTRDHALGSMLTFVRGDGRPVCSFWIAKGDFADESVGKVEAFSEDHPYGLRGSWPRYNGFTDTGYLNAEMFEACFDAFVKEWVLQENGKTCWVFGDQLASHTSLDVCARAYKNGVEMWLLPTNTSHFLQPLDHVIFAAFKAWIKRNTYRELWTAAFSKKSPTEVLWALCYAAEHAVFTKRTIMSAFNATGLCPWNPERI
jgi:hypothetical protein